MKKTSFVSVLMLGIVLNWMGSTVLVSARETSQPVPVLEIRADRVTAQVSPMLYGLMTEEINHAYDGGLYAELIRNRIFKETPLRRLRPGQPAAQANPPRADGLRYWELVQTGGGVGAMAQDANQPMNAALTNSLRLTVTKVGESQRVGISNEGFWGIPVRPNTAYQARIHAKGGSGFVGPLTLAIVSPDGKTVYAQAQIAKITEGYQRYDATLTTGNVPTTADTRFHIWAGGTGTVWFSLVSLFPPTYQNRPNGNRIDLMQLLKEMKPAFLRFPGGNYLEGNTIATRFDWKKTIGDIAERPGHPCDAWSYWSSDGMGLLEFLLWCEDLDMEPVLGIYAGYSLRREFVKPGDDLKPYVQDGLDEIEYVMGDTSTTWGARRARDGHPASFKLTYVEIGNEENLGNRGGTGNEYDARFAQFYDAIKARYPQLKIIGATPIDTNVLRTRKPDVYDDHFYRNSMQMQSDTHHYDKLDRKGPKVFVGEWATREGTPTPNLSAALSDASWMLGMERNSDLVIMHAYAPLLVNVNPGGMQWQTDLIGYDTLTSYGSPAYHAQKMFSVEHGDTVLAVAAQNIPTRPWTPTRRGGPSGGADQQPPAPQQVPTLFYNATRDHATGLIYLKVVNAIGTPQPVHVTIGGAAGIEPNGEAVEMKGESTQDTNTITAPTKIVPVTRKVDGLGADFTRTFPPYSITVLKIKSK